MATTVPEAGTTMPAAPTTYVPVLDDDQAPAVPRPGLGRATSEERFVAIGSWVSAFAVAWIVTQRVLPLSGLPWLVLTTFVVGLAVSAVTSALVGRRTDVVDRVVASLITGGALLVGAALFSTILFILKQGWEPLTHLSFWTEDMSGVGPRDPLGNGGVLHAAAGSLIELGIAIAITVPLGVGTAVFMTEVGGRFARIVRTIVEAMTALPSIVAGLFIYTTLIVALGVPKSGFADRKSVV